MKGRFTDSSLNLEHDDLKVTIANALERYTANEECGSHCRTLWRWTKNLRVCSKKFEAVEIERSDAWANQTYFFTPVASWYQRWIVVQCNQAWVEDTGYGWSSLERHRKCPFAGNHWTRWWGEGKREDNEKISITALVVALRFSDAVRRQPTQRHHAGFHSWRLLMTGDLFYS